MAVADPCYFIFEPRNPDYDFSFKKDPNEELKIYSFNNYHVMLIGVQPGKYTIVYRSRINPRKKGFFVKEIKRDQFISIQIPPYGID